MKHEQASGKLRNLITTKPALLTVFAGDSHTWGQGAEGWFEALKPRFVTGEWRRLPENIPCFAQLFYKYLKNRRPSAFETYVINSGYGCASTKVYLDEYWSHAVEPYRPDIVVLEFAINDWLSDRNVSVKEFGGNLNRMIDQCIQIESLPILLTVSPIRGSQWSHDHFYQDYIDRTRIVAQERPEVVLADANRLMTLYIEKDETQSNLLFYDDWHVAQIGQEIYCQALIEAIEEKRGTI